MILSMLGLSGGDIGVGSARGNCNFQYIGRVGPWWDAIFKSLPSFRENWTGRCG